MIFKVTDKGGMLMPCDIKAKAPYSQQEREKIERLVAERGKTYKTPQAAKKHLKSM